MELNRKDFEPYTDVREVREISEIEYKGRKILYRTTIEKYGTLVYGLGKERKRINVLGIQTKENGDSVIITPINFRDEEEKDLKHYQLRPESKKELEKILGEEIIFTPEEAIIGF